MRDEVVIMEMIRRGDDDGFRYITDIYSPMIRGIIRKVYVKTGDFRLDYDDLYQEGLLALSRAVRLFDQNGQGSIDRYVYVAVKRSIIRKAVYYRKLYEHEQLSLDRDIFTDSSILFLNSARSIEDPKNRFRLKELKKALFALFESLDPLEKEILQLKREGHSYRDIADLLGCSTKKIDNLLQKVRKKIRKVLEGYY